ncbi:MAG TPA: type II toxin-antitoxin system VapC family toxin [Polyangia bacterium]|nr:type II toxin-antitoxin system VapC family toxin [Polyangia bacterium]
MSLYLDASVLVPTLIDESGSEAIFAFLAAADEAIVVSDFAAMEVASALSRLVRMKYLTGAGAEALLREFDSWRAIAATGSALQGSDARLADIFVRRFDLGLRAPDALHLALCRRDNHGLLTLDRRLAAAAEALGVAVRRVA